MLVNILNSSVKLPLNRIQIVWNYCSFLLLFSSSRNRLHSICSFFYCCFLCVKDIYFKMCFHFNQFSSSLSKWNIYRMPLHINSMILWIMTLKCWFSFILLPCTTWMLNGIALSLVYCALHWADDDETMEKALFHCKFPPHQLLKQTNPSDLSTI